MKLRITGRIDAAVIERITADEQDLDVEVWSRPGVMPRRTLIDWARDAEMLLCMLTERIDEELIAAAAPLHIVSNMAVGFDNLDLKSLSQHGILATNTPDVLTEATAELTVALMLMTMRRLNQAEADLRRGEWKGWEPDGFLGVEVQQKTLGLVGYGRIAQSVARRAQAMGMNPLIFTRRKIDIIPPGMRQVGWDELLACSDVISLHVPLTHATYHLINAQALARMSVHAFLINTARGPIVDESALVQAVQSGHIAGAGLDVFEREPLPLDSPLRTLPGIVLLPHVGSATVETRRAMAWRAWCNLRDWMHGAQPRDLLNADVWLKRKR